MTITGRFFHFMLIISVLSSCDCYVSVKGKVLSSTDKKPIAGAKVEMIGRNLTTSTDRNGFFHIWKQTGFCFNPIIKITSENYKSFEISFKSSSNSKSFELKSESDFVNYEKPFYPDKNNKKTFLKGTWIAMFSEKFAFNGDTILFYLDTINPKKEIRDIQEQIKKNDPNETVN